MKNKLHASSLEKTADKICLNENEILQCLQEHQKTMQKVEELIPAIHYAAKKMNSILLNGGKILWMGNGGSAADAQHLAGELVGRFMEERSAIASIALTTDSSILTSLANDYQYEYIFVRQIEALARPDDLVVGISTSGNSQNVCLAIKKCREMGVATVAFTGEKGGELAELADICIRAPSQSTPRIQEAHIFIGHTICEYLEKSVLSLCK